MRLSAPKKCPPLEHGIKQSKLACWLREKARLTAELANQIVKPFTEWTTWNEAARQAYEKRKACSTTTAKVVAPIQSKYPHCSTD